MHRLVAAFLCRTTVGAVVIAVAVPMIQNQVLVLAHVEVRGPALSVRGDVSGLSAGHLGRLVLTVRNDGDAPTTVRHLTTVVRQQIEGCSLTVAPWSGVMELAAGGASSQAVVVRVSGRGCDGSRWALDYTASA